MGWWGISRLLGAAKLQSAPGADNSRYTTVPLQIWSFPKKWIPLSLHPTHKYCWLCTCEHVCILCPANYEKKRRKVGRPPGGHSNLELAAKRPGRRKRHRRIVLTLRKKHGASASTSCDVIDDVGDYEIDSHSTGSGSEQVNYCSNTRYNGFEVGRKNIGQINLLLILLFVYVNLAAL